MVQQAQQAVKCVEYGCDHRCSMLDSSSRSRGSNSSEHKRNWFVLVRHSYVDTTAAEPGTWYVISLQWA